MSDHLTTEEDRKPSMLSQFQILVVDDDEDMVLLIKSRLKKLGLICSVACDREEALLMESKMIEAPLMLLDHLLPGCTGLEVLQQILRTRPDTVAIVMSATEDAKAVVEYMKAGARDYLFKGEGFLDMLSHVTLRTLKVMEQERRLKDAELSLRLNEQLLVRSQHIAMMGSWRMDIATAKLIWSKAMYSLLEIEDGELSEPSDDWFIERIHDCDRQKLLEARANTLRSKDNCPVEFSYLKSSSSTPKIFRAVHDVDFDKNGMPASIYGTLQDITASKRSEMERLKLSQAVEQSSASIAITDPGGIIEYVNAKFLQVSGYTREEVLGQNPRILKSGEHSVAFYEKMWKTLLAGQPWQGELCNRCKNGDLVWESVSISLIRNDRGELVHYLAVKEDITEKKKFQKTMLKLNKALIAANKETEKLAADFELFVPKQFTRRMREEGPGIIRAGFAQEENITMMFADIRSFTSLSESLGSEATFKFLNEYLQRVEPCIKKNSGFVDKFVGDGIVALFDGVDGPIHAVKAAIEIQLTVAEFNAERPHIKDIVLGIGIHSGRVIIGALGSNTRLDSTVIGDAVNTTARVEELTKRFKAQILITDEVIKGLPPNTYLIRDVMSVKVRGRHEITNIFEVFDANPPNVRNLKSETKNDIEEGVRKYRLHEFEAAQICFDKALKVNPIDVLAMDYAVRCRYLRKFPTSELSQLGVLEDVNHYLNHSSQRRDIRHSISLMGHVQWANAEFDKSYVRLSNLSLRGVKMDECSLDLKIGSILKLRMMTAALLPYIKEDVESVCQVVWVSGTENPSFGLQFVWISHEHENGVIYLIEQLEQGARP